MLRSELRRLVVDDETIDAGEHVARRLCHIGSRAWIGIKRWRCAAVGDEWRRIGRSAAERDLGKAGQPLEGERRSRVGAHWYGVVD